jgi:RNA polymerase sigma factor (TIGR02999 family)
MRRILVDHARRRDSLKRGGDFHRVELPDVAMGDNPAAMDILALDEALNEFASKHPEKAQLVKLRYFAGCSLEESAEHLGVSRATAQRYWAFARAWLFGRMTGE